MNRCVGCAVSLGNGAHTFELNGKPWHCACLLQYYQGENRALAARLAKPEPGDIQNLQTIRRAINRTAYHGGLGIKESGKMLGTMDRLLASFGVGPDDHGELEDDDPLKAVQAGTVDKLDVYERAATSIARSGQRPHEGDNCRCPTPMTCPYCSRMYPCDCAGCPSKPKPDMCSKCHRSSKEHGVGNHECPVTGVDAMANEMDNNFLVETMRAVGVDVVEASEQRAQDKVQAARVCKTCKVKPVVTYKGQVYDSCHECYAKGYGK